MAKAQVAAIGNDQITSQPLIAKHEHMDPHLHSPIQMECSWISVESWPGRLEQSGVSQLQPAQLYVYAFSK